MITFLLLKGRIHILREINVFQQELQNWYLFYHDKWYSNIKSATLISSGHLPLFMT